MMINRIKSLLAQNSRVEYFLETLEIDLCAIEESREHPIFQYYFFIAPIEPYLNINEAIIFENVLFKELHQNPNLRINYVPSSISDEQWFFGYGFIIEKKIIASRLTAVGNETPDLSYDEVIDFHFYPHIDLARTAFLNSGNRTCIELKDLRYYRQDSTKTAFLPNCGDHG